jgi:hypothetical protein
VQSPHNTGEGYGKKEKQAIMALLEAGADEKHEVVAEILKKHPQHVTRDTS